VSFADYKFLIRRATEGGLLHQISADVQADDYLSASEKYDLEQMIRHRFGQLNAAAIGKPTPRWSETGGAQ